MGIGFHELNFLSYCQKNNNFQTLGIIGRQENYISKDHPILNAKNKDYIYEKYSDNLLKNHLKLSKIETFDVSIKENSSIISNFNNHVEVSEKFDAFFDGGSLQHIFNVPNALKNISNHTKIGGIIIHIASANNLCGFGFYQFSPEFFLNYYSKKNGFKNTKIFIADYDNEKYWYQLKEKEYNNSQIYINTTQRLICLVSTEKFEDKEIKSIFQNQYTDNTQKEKNSIIKKMLLNNYFVKKVVMKIYFKILLFFSLICNSCHLNRNNYFEKKKIIDLVKFSKL